MWKYLRIAVTAVSLLVCGLLIVLWVRSYSRRDFFWFPVWRPYTLETNSEMGEIAFILSSLPELEFTLLAGWDVSESRPDDGWSPPLLDVGVPPGNESIMSFATRHWLAAIITATIAALPWIKWRFSLRTLLLAMTLFALFFGAIAMSM